MCSKYLQVTWHNMKNIITRAVGVKFSEVTQVLCHAYTFMYCKKLHHHNPTASWLVVVINKNGKQDRSTSHYTPNPFDERVTFELQHACLLSCLCVHCTICAFSHPRTFRKCIRNNSTNSHAQGIGRGTLEPNRPIKSNTTVCYQVNSNKWNLFATKM